MASAFSTDTVPARTARATPAIHGVVGSRVSTGAASSTSPVSASMTGSGVRSASADSTRSVPTATVRVASRSDEPVVTRTNSAGVRCPFDCANPFSPNSGAERRATSPATSASCDRMCRSCAARIPASSASASSETPRMRSASAADAMMSESTPDWSSTRSGDSGARP